MTKPINDENEMFVVEYSDLQKCFHYESYDSISHRPAGWYKGDDWYTLGTMPLKDVFDFMQRKEKEFAENERREKSRDRKKLRGSHSNKIRTAVLKRDGYKCVLCGRSPKKDGIVIEACHRIAESKGGKYTMENLFAGCYDCNRGM